MENIEVITRLTFLFFLYLVMAIFVERFMEVLVSIFGYVEFKRKFANYWNGRALVLQKRFDRLYGYQGENAPKTEKILNWVLWKVVAERPYVGGRESISAELIRLNYLRTTTRIVAFLVSLAFTLYLEAQLGIDLVLLAESMLSGTGGAAYKILGALSDYPALRVIISAAAISIGTEPLHQIISQVEKLAASKTVATGGTKS
jgi:hypothetical protein